MSTRFLSKVKPAVCTGLQRSVIGQGGLACNSVRYGIGQSSLLLGGSGLVFSLPCSTRLFNHSTRFHLSSPCRRRAMAVSGSKAMFGDVYIDDLVSSCGNGVDFTKSSGVYFSDRTRISCRKACISFRKQEHYNGHLVCGYFMPKVQGNTSSNTIFGPFLKNVHTFSSVCFSAGPVHDVSCDDNSQEQELEDSPISSSQPLNLLSGSCYLPHPAKEDTGGEDAHFICTDKQAIGVADGVGGWADVGVDAGEFSRELMSNSLLALEEETKGSINPYRVLEKAHAKTKAKGSSTACIIALTDEGLHAINLGDSGFIVVRDGCTIFHSPVQQHGFNFTYQLESGNGGDLPSSGQVFTIPVAPGDVVVAGTDGLFDNLYNNEVSAVVVEAIRAGLTPQATAQKVAALARQRALDKNRQTPFSSAAQDAGYRYYGGKLDDITVVISFVARSNDL
ncbi:probable protein phosphatase 2C 80 isoform X1 [Carica papaya]|uniref:probable protein phosphatase 2C 80 isoform X1 n=1 Tax=Carica papaya TaxID=3649 RepID=UPI000B8CF73E|nr:probable protein phosphatase 2C 80 isoform X1 [Carica papaya]